MRAVCLVFLASLILLTDGWTLQKPQDTPSTFRPVASVSQIMKAIVVPSSDAVFAAAGEAPQDEAGWTAVQNSAIVLMESGNLLLIPGRSKDQDEWLKASQELVELGSKAPRAAEIKNADELAEVSDLIYGSCESCHATYYKDRQGNQ